MKLTNEQFNECVTIAFRSAVLLKIGGFTGEVEARDLISPALYLQLNDTNQLKSFAMHLQEKIKLDGGIYQIAATDKKSEGRRIYSIG